MYLLYLVKGPPLEIFVEQAHEECDLQEFLVLLQLPLVGSTAASIERVWSMMQPVARRNGQIIRCSNATKVVAKNVPLIWPMRATRATWPQSRPRNGGQLLCCVVLS